MVGSIRAWLNSLTRCPWHCHSWTQKTTIGSLYLSLSASLHFHVYLNFKYFIKLLDRNNKPVIATLTTVNNCHVRTSYLIMWLYYTILNNGVRKRHESNLMWDSSLASTHTHQVTLHCNEEKVVTFFLNKQEHSHFTFA